MPWTQRIATFRDDVLFLLFLFQMWKYRTDYKHVNECSKQHDTSSESTADNITDSQYKLLDTLPRGHGSTDDEADEWEVISAAEAKEAAAKALEARKASELEAKAVEGSDTAPRSIMGLSLR